MCVRACVCVCLCVCACVLNRLVCRAQVQSVTPSRSTLKIDFGLLPSVCLSLLFTHVSAFCTHSVLHQSPPADLPTVAPLAHRPLEAILSASSSVCGEFEEPEPYDQFVKFVKGREHLNNAEFTKQMVAEYGILQRSVFFCQVFFKNNLFTLHREIQVLALSQPCGTLFA